ncbi:MAG: hypothetical protein OES18_21445 [Deltaproteobacteria bacterium]|nr:hypothetical protein [Deltaproteobacteria bacterium]
MFEVVGIPSVNLKLNAEQLCEAIEELHCALNLLDSVLKELESGAMMGMAISDRLAEAWYKVNCCRLYTESDVNLDEFNVEAMGLINDAKCMVDSLVSWGKGMTSQGKISITSCISNASRNLTFVLCELEDWLNRLAR